MNKMPASVWRSSSLANTRNTRSFLSLACSLICLRTLSGPVCLLHAWAVSPQPVSPTGCGLDPQRNTATQMQVAPPPAPAADDAPAIKATIGEHWSLVRQQRYEEAYDLFSTRFKSRVSREGWVNDKLR